MCRGVFNSCNPELTILNRFRAGPDDENRNNNSNTHNINHLTIIVMRVICNERRSKNARINKPLKKKKTTLEVPVAEGLGLRI